MLIAFGVDQNGIPDKNTYTGYNLVTVCSKHIKNKITEEKGNKKSLSKLWSVIRVFYTNQKTLTSRVYIFISEVPCSSPAFKHAYKLSILDTEWTYIGN